MRVLLDTNIVIAREDPVSPPEGLADLLRRLAAESIATVIHPVTAAELDRDTDLERRAITLAKARCYPVIASPPSAPSDFVANSGGSGGPHDVNDIALLYSLKCEAVDFLVTEDRDLFRRAARVGLDARVFSIREAAEYFRVLFSEHIPTAQRILQLSPVHSLIPYLDAKDPLFDSILEDYSQFDSWLRRIARQGRKCIWVPAPGGGVGAVLIYKDESESIGTGARLSARRRLKLCTFKVSPKVARQRVSELLLAWALEYAKVNGFEEAYVTAFPEHQLLISVLESFGFEQVGTRPLGERSELILLKRLAPRAGDPELSPEKYFRHYFPTVRDDRAVHKFLVPIQPAWHSRLFPEYQEDPSQRTLDEFGGLVGELADPAGNAIRKAYICHSPVRSVRPGDLLLFYRSQGQGRVTHKAVVDSTRICSDVQQVVQFVGNRTVLPLRQIERMCSRPVFALVFWNTGPLDPARPAGVPLPAGRPWPQSISEVSEEDYRQLCH